MPSRVEREPAATLRTTIFERDDLHLADELLAHVQPTDEVGRHADIAQPSHQVFADAVVEHAFAGDHAFFGAVARGRVVLEVLHQSAGLRPFKQDLCLALVKLPAPGHSLYPRIACAL